MCSHYGMILYHCSVPIFISIPPFPSYSYLLIFLSSHTLHSSFSLYTPHNMNSPLCLALTGYCSDVYIRTSIVIFNLTLVSNMTGDGRLGTQEVLNIKCNISPKCHVLYTFHLTLRFCLNLYLFQSEF